MAIVACVVGLWLTAITTTAHARVEGDTIVLGAVLSFSGQYQTNGHNTLNGYDLAVDRINAEGGVTVDGEKYKLRIIYYDDESNRIRASALAETTRTTPVTVTVTPPAPTLTHRGFLLGAQFAVTVGVETVEQSLPSLAAAVFLRDSEGRQRHGEDGGGRYKPSRAIHPHLLS